MATPGGPPDADAVALLEACLPAELRGPATSITRLGGGLSGAAVYRVATAKGAYVLKVTDASLPEAAWRQRVEIQRGAADAGVAPRVIHADAARRAVVSELVAARGLAPRLHDPRTRAVTLRLLGGTIRRVHALPLVEPATWRDPRDLAVAMRARLATFAVPGFVGAALDDVLAEAPPPSRGPWVTSHNDLNPSNLVFAGERLVLLDWDQAGPNDPYYDLATVAVFLRMDDPTAALLLAAYGTGRSAALPAGFIYARRLVAALCASIFCDLARQGGHPGGDVPLERAPTLAEVHGLIGVGALAPAEPAGAWAFALALARTIATRVA
ncbi:MAG: phosphotransferase [Kofleriaceae bacterium]